MTLYHITQCHALHNVKVTLYYYRELSISYMSTCPKARQGFIQDLDLGGGEVGKGSICIHSMSV